MKILYIEDDERLAMLVCLLLRGHGHEVVHVMRGQAGLEKFYEGLSSWSAVIIDLDLPDISGRTLIPEMAARCPTLPIIVCSGMQGPRYGLENRFDLYSSGASAFLPKPHGAQQLLDVLKELVEVPPTPLD